MKRLGITGKLVLSSVSILLCLGVALTWYSVLQFRRILYEETVRRVEAQTLNWIEANTQQITLSRTPRTLDRLVQELKQREGIAYVILTDEKGQWLAQTGVPTGLGEVGPAPAVSALKSRPVVMRDGSGVRYFEIVTPISASGTGMSADLESMFSAAAHSQTVGLARVAVQEAELGRRMGGLVSDTIGLYALLILAALALSSGLANRMVTPITNMARAANQIAAGKLSERVGKGLERRDEVGDLVRNFNRMAERLEENREEMNLLYAGLEDKVRERTLELEQANRRLQELDQLKSHFLSTVSHELRSPLTSIKAFAEILLDSPNPDPATRTRFLEIIDKESDRLSRLISDLLDLAKIESGAISWRIDKADLRQITSAAVAILAGQGADKSVLLAVRDTDAQPVWGDTDRLQQVVTNLVANAIKFSPAGSQVEVRLDRITRSRAHDSVQRSYVRVAVADSGPGIPPEDHDRVFEKFYQASRTRAASSGTGLGLAISREIVLHHQGEIWVQSEPGRGSTFFFTIPLREEKSGDELPAPEISGEGRR